MGTPAGADRRSGVTGPVVRAGADLYLEMASPGTPMTVGQTALGQRPRSATGTRACFVPCIDNLERRETERFLGRRRWTLCERFVCRHRSAGCQACCGFAFILVLLVAVAGILVAIHYPDTNPPVQIDCDDRGFALDSTEFKLDAECRLTFTNRNEYAVNVVSGNAYIYHDQRQFHHVSVPSYTFPPRETTTLTIPFSLRAQVGGENGDIVMMVVTTCRSTTEIPIDIRGIAQVTTSFAPFSLTIPFAGKRQIQCPPVIPIVGLFPH